MTRGHRGSLLLRCRAFSSLSSCRFIPAHPTFHVKAADRARVAYMPGTAWPVTGSPPDSSWNLVLAPVLMPPETNFDTSTAIRLRSPSRSPPDASCAPFPTRSRQRSSANAAVGGLTPLPEERRRRATTFIFHAAAQSIEVTYLHPGSTPAASPRLRRRQFAMASRPGLLRPSREFPARHEGRVRAANQPGSAGLAAGGCSRGVTAPVPRVYLPVSLTAPGPSGSAEPARLCRGCSRPPRPTRGSGCLQLHPAATTARRWTVFHLHPQQQRLVAHLLVQPDRE